MKIENLVVFGSFFTIDLNNNKNVAKCGNNLKTYE